MHFLQLLATVLRSGSSLARIQIESVQVCRSCEVDHVMLGYRLSLLTQRRQKVQFVQLLPYWLVQAYTVLLI